MYKFSKEECTAIIELSKKIEKKHVSKIAKFDNLDYSFFSINRSSETQWIFDRFSSFLLDRFPDNKVSLMPVVNLHKYVVGSRFVRHSDLKRNNTHIYVTGSVISEGFTGGDFILYDPEEVLTREAGYIYGFDTRREHEVTEVFEGERWALVMFLTKEDLNIKSKLF